MPKAALQTYTIRRSMDMDIRASLARVREIGLQAIELARVDFSRESIEDIASICRDTGIEVGSIQIKLSAMEKDREGLSEIMGLLGCRYAVIPLMPFSCLRGRGALAAYCRRLEDTGRFLTDRGLRLLYHHHHYEFVPVEGVLPVDFILAHTDPALVGLCADTYWVQRGGYDPAAFIRAWAGRVKVVHLRDYTLTPPYLLPRVSDARLGGGTLDFAAIVQACDDAGVAYMPIEQSTKTPFIDAAKSVAHLRSLGLEGLL